MSRKKSRGALRDDEKKLWNKVTEDITKLDSNRVATPLVRKSVYTMGARDPMRFDPVSPQNFIKAPATGLTEQSFPSGAFTLRDADHNWHQKLRRGKVKPEGKVDLHGMTQDRAYGVLNRYIEDAQRRGRRFILVVTGKGGLKSGYGDMSHSDYDQGRGILKTNVPRWLSQGPLASRIVSYYSANPEHGGEGALYVVLKRNRGS